MSDLDIFFTAGLTARLRPSTKRAADGEGFVSVIEADFDVGERLTGGLENGEPEEHGLAVEVLARGGGTHWPG